MLSSLIIFAVLQLLINIFFFWKIINFERSRFQLFTKVQEMFRAIDVMAKDIVRIKRALTTAQSQKFIDSTCQECGALLPENTMRTHDGLRLCVRCKEKHFEPLVPAEKAVEQ